MTGHVDLSQACDRAADRARRELAARHPDRFSSLFCYGAIDIDPAHLVVWVLLAGDPDELPAWYLPDRDRADGDRYSATLLAQIDSMRHVVVSSFAGEGWPAAEQISVGFDSESRVATGGGFHYFK